MADLIDRQAAIAVADFSDYVGLSVEDVKKVTDEVVKGLKQLPSAQPEPKWIPCTSTKRPKNREEVMVTIDNGYQRYTDTDEFVNGQYWYHDDKQVVAWKSFDEPWRGEEHDKG